MKSMLAFAFFLTACSNLESVESKIARYHSKGEAPLIIPEFPMKKLEYREVASLASKPISTKKLYFQLIMGQLISLAPYSTLAMGDEFQVCPQFHQLNKRMEASKKELKYDFSKVWAQMMHLDPQLPPEFLLPINYSSKSPRVVDMALNKGQLHEGFVKEYLQKAIDLHFTKVKHEVTELCQYGQTDQSFIFENLKTAQLKGSDENQKAMLKTFFFANMALINSLQGKHEGRQLSSEEDNAVFTHLGVHWIKSYL